MLGMLDPKRRADSVILKVSGGESSRDSEYEDGFKKEMKMMAFGEFVNAVKANDISRAFEAFMVFQKLCKYEEN